LAVFRVQPTFGRGLRPPVQINEPVKVRVCLGCGFAEFTVSEDGLAQLRDGMSLPASSWIARRFAEVA